MSKRINDGGQAFPVPGYYPDDPNGRLEPGERFDRSNEPQPGMSLRDWFAGQALAGLVSIAAGRTHGGSARITINTHDFAQAAYGCADAMIEAREAETATEGQQS